jgi:hypothetical protein
VNYLDEMAGAGRPAEQVAFLYTCTEIGSVVVASHHKDGATRRDRTGDLLITNPVFGFLADVG